MRTRRDDGFPGQVGRREKRKLRARQEEKNEVWFGLGMFGVVGWSVAIPTLAGVFFGIWLDRAWPGPHSWTLMLLVIGLILGCLNAWLWVRRQTRAIGKQR